jgi:hypothetical protein
MCLRLCAGSDGEGVKRFRSHLHYLRSGNSSARGVLVNPDHCSLPAEKQNSVVTTKSLDVNLAGPRIERCEFEKLLQRAMEILKVRDLKGQLKENA